MRIEHDFIPELPDVDSCKVTNCGLREANRVHRKTAGSEGDQRYEVEREVDAKHDQVMSARGAEWDAKVIDQAILATAATGTEFSSNDVRPLLPEVRKALIGQRFAALARAGFIEQTGRYVGADKKHIRHRVAIWRATEKYRRAS